MRSRVFAGALLIMGVLAVGTLAAGDANATSSPQWVITHFFQPTAVAGVYIQGSVMIVHDDERMAKGEPCTTIYRFDPSHGPQEQLVSFMCEPMERDVVSKFTVRCARQGLTGPDMLTSYQFAGDTEAHGVPSSSR